MADAVLGLTKYQRLGADEASLSDLRVYRQAWQASVGYAREQVWWIEGRIEHWPLGRVLAEARDEDLAFFRHRLASDTAALTEVEAMIAARVAAGEAEVTYQEQQQMALFGEG